MGSLRLSTLSNRNVPWQPLLEALLCNVWRRRQKRSKLRLYTTKPPRPSEGLKVPLWCRPAGTIGLFTPAREEPTLAVSSSGEGLFERTSLRLKLGSGTFSFCRETADLGSKTPDTLARLTGARKQVHVRRYVQIPKDVQVLRI